MYANRMKLAVLLAVALTVPAGAAPLGTAFTYQGSLADAGVPVDGTVDMRFLLWNDSIAGGQLGSTIEFSGAGIAVGPPVNVVGGLFTVDLDFGVAHFDGQDVYLEIEVDNPSGSGAWTTLTPRQRVAPTPYALQTRGLFVDDALRVGLGTQNPSHQLHVVSGTESIAVFGQQTAAAGVSRGVLGRSESTGGIGVLGLVGALSGDTRGVQGETTSTLGRGVYGVATAGTGENYGVYGRTNSSDGYAGYFEGRGYFSDDLGVAITDPTSMLHVFRDSDDSRPTVTFETIDQFQTNLSLRLLFEGTSIDAFARIALNPFSTDLRLNASSSGDVLIVQGGGDVGVNTSTPDGKLHVVGDGFATITGGGIVVVEHGPSGYQLAMDGTRLQARRGGSASTLRLNPTGNGDITMLEAAAGRVGIGLPQPLAPVHIRNSTIELESGAVAPHADVVIEDTDAVLALYSNDGPNWASAIVLGQIDDSVSPPVLKNKWSIAMRTGGELRFLYGDETQPGHSAGTAVLRLTPNGTTKVKVLEILGADIAEKFPTSESDAVEPGTVMEIDPDNAGKLRVSRGAYNRRVAGVVSGAGDIPVGALLGNLPGSEDEPAIALSGRVWVRCDATERAIEPGDLLTTADRPGHAMKVEDHARATGATIGKAMSALAKGETGMVLVLVNLQ